MTYDSPWAIGGFQSNVTGVTVTGASGGDAGANQFTVSTGPAILLGFSLTGSTIPAGSGVLTVVSFEGYGETCLDNAVVSDAAGGALDSDNGNCVTIEEVRKGLRGEGAVARVKVLRGAKEVRVGWQELGSCVRG